jgi:hypothetical protein
MDLISLSFSSIHQNGFVSIRLTFFTIEPTLPDFFSGLGEGLGEGSGLGEGLGFSVGLGEGEGKADGSGFGEGSTLVVAAGTFDL